MLLLLLLLTVKEINSFKEHIFIHKKYNHSRQLYFFTELYLFQGTYQFIQRNYIHSRKYLHSRKTYSFREIISFKEYIHLRNIYSSKFRVICLFKETIFIQQRCVREHSRNINSKVVPRHFMIITSFKYNYYVLNTV